MNNAGTVLIHRFAGIGLPCTRWTQPLKVMRPISLPFQSPRVFSQSWSSRSFAPTQSPRHRAKAITSRQLFSTTSKAAVQRAFNPQANNVSQRQDEEKGLAFQEEDLDLDELDDIFGAVRPPPRIANRFLRVLHGRRIDGTLDLPLPPSLQELTKRYPYAMDSAIYWLRGTYPVDEDAAILARIEREENGQDYSPTELQQRAQDLGLYAPKDEYTGPQSGYYQAPISEKEDDVYGQSELDKIRAENIAEAEREEAELQAQIDEKMARYQELRDEKSKAIAERLDQNIEVADGTVRPPNVFERWKLLHEMKGTSKVTETQAVEMSLTQRLLPSAVFVALVCAGSFLFAQYWVPPRRSERMYPDTALSFATVGALIALNFVVFTAWRLPPLWKVLNKYFVATPGYPRATSMLFSIFSHQTPGHFLTNMFGLMIFGLSLHEEIGRGNFLAIYIASGAVGSIASLTSFAVKRIFISSSLGASGSVWGITAAYCWLHASDKFSLWFLPRDIQAYFQWNGWMLLGGMVAYEVFRFTSPIKTIDHAAHLGGMVVGVVSAQMYKMKVEQSTEKGEKKRHLRWYQILTGQVGGGDVGGDK